LRRSVRKRGTKEVEKKREGPLYNVSSKGRGKNVLPLNIFRAERRGRSVRAAGGKGGEKALSKGGRKPRVYSM